eukprot:4740755-Prymnesium_polylepis.1
MFILVSLDVDTCLRGIETRPPQRPLADTRRRPRLYDPDGSPPAASVLRRRRLVGGRDAARVQVGWRPQQRAASLAAAAPDCGADVDLHARASVARLPRARRPVPRARPDILAAADRHGGALCCRQRAHVCHVVQRPGNGPARAARAAAHGHAPDGARGAGQGRARRAQVLHRLRLPPAAAHVALPRDGPLHRQVGPLLPVGGQRRRPAELPALCAFYHDNVRARGPHRRRVRRPAPPPVGGACCRERPKLRRAAPCRARAALLPAAAVHGDRDGAAR